MKASGWRWLILWLGLSTLAHASLALWWLGREERPSAKKPGRRRPPATITLMPLRPVPAARAADGPQAPTRPPVAGRSGPSQRPAATEESAIPPAVSPPGPRPAARPATRPAIRPAIRQTARLRPQTATSPPAPPSEAQGAQKPASPPAGAPAAQPTAAPPSFGVELSAESDALGDGSPASDTGAGAAEGRGAPGEAGPGRPAGGGEGSAFDVAPRVVGTCQARFPQEATARGQHGQVVVEVHIEADGSVSRAEVVQSMGPAFDREALDAMRACHYIPASLAGHSVASVVEHRFIFRPQQD